MLHFLYGFSYLLSLFLLIETEQMLQTNNGILSNYTES